VYLKCDLSCLRSSATPRAFTKRPAQERLQQFTGISDPYEEPVSPEIVIETDRLSVSDSIDIIISHLKAGKII